MGVYDQFAEITQPLQDQGMTIEHAVLAEVGQQAERIGTVYLTLEAMGIRPEHALSLTHQWVDCIQGVADDDG